jgi:uncharacterized protein DUF4035
LGGRTVAEWQQAMSADEFANWMAEYQISPFGPYREDLRAGIITSQLLTPHLKKGATPLKPEDFIPRFGASTPTPRMTSKEIRERLQMMFGRKLHG